MCIRDEEKVGRVECSIRGGQTFGRDNKDRARQAVREGVVVGVGVGERGERIRAERAITS